MVNRRVVVICSNDFSDIYFANQLIKRLNVVGVVVERQYQKSGILKKCVKLGKMAFRPWQLVKKIRNESTYKHYYQLSKKVDLEHFGEEALKLYPNDQCKVIYADGHKAISKPEHIEAIKSLNPDIMALCGCSIIPKEIIALPPLGVVNLHGGLAQKYRGVWTTLWAIHNAEPEYVGATVHFVDPGIDTGKIIFQGRPKIEENDNPETLYVKVVKLGVEMVTKAIQDIQNGTVKTYPLNALGDLYLAKNVTAEVLKKAWDQIERGLIKEYLRDKKERDKKVTKLMVTEFSHT